MDHLRASLQAAEMRPTDAPIWTSQGAGGSTAPSPSEKPQGARDAGDRKREGTDFKRDATRARRCRI
jgi:hypothetical protein